MKNWERKNEKLKINKKSKLKVCKFKIIKLSIFHNRDHKQPKRNPTRRVPSLIGAKSLNEMTLNGYFGILYYNMCWVKNW